MHSDFVYGCFADKAFALSAFYFEEFICIIYYEGISVKILIKSNININEILTKLCYVLYIVLNKNKIKHRLLKILYVNIQNKYN